jgi:hypothetical protein
MDRKHGGKREGAGRPKAQKNYSDKFKADMLKALGKKAKLEGKTIFDVYADRLFDPKTQSSVFASLMKVMADVMATKETKSTVETHNYGPVIGLPPIKEKPPEASYPMEPGLVN